MRLSKAQSDALDLFHVYEWFDEIEVMVYGIRKPTLRVLEEHGLIRWCPYGKPPKWRLTKLGQETGA